MMKTIALGIGIFLGLTTYTNAGPSNDPAYYGSCFPKEKSVTQSFVIDNRTQEAFGYNLKRMAKGSDAFGAVISTYPLKNGDMKYTSRTGPYDQLGHQGLSIQYRQGVRYFWSSVSADYSQDSGNYAARYRVVNGVLVNFTTFKLFEKKNTHQSITPTISYGQKYLLVKMGNKFDYEIRIFDLAQFEKTTKAVSQHSFRITVDLEHDKGMALQSLAGDDHFLYVLMGSVEVGKHNRIDIYTLNGHYVRTVAIHQGEEAAKATGKGSHYEPEWLTWLQQGNKAQLMLSVAAGDQGARQCLIYDTGIFANEK